MKDPQRCCFRALTSASSGPVARLTEALPVVSPAPFDRDPLPNALPPPRMPELPASQWQSFSPTTTMKGLCRALIETCKSAGEPPQLPSIHHRLVVSLAYLHGYDHRRYLAVLSLQVLYMMSFHCYSTLA